MAAINKRSSTPIKEQVRQWLLAQITSGQLGAGDKAPSINWLAREFGISRETVRLSLDSLVQRGVLVPEHGKGYFVARREARAPRVALLAKVDGVYIRPIYQGLVRELGPQANVIIMDNQSSRASLSAMVENLAYHQAVDRLLVIPVRGQEEPTSKVLAPFRRYFRVAWLDRAHRETRDSTFLCDYPRCVDLALEHLESCGTTASMYFSREPADRSVFSAMRRAFRRSASNLDGIKCPLTEWKEVARVLKKRGSSAPTGVFAETNAEAVYLQGRLLAAGVRIPQDVSIVSCDDTEMAELVSPALTTVDPGFEELGFRAGEWIKAEQPEDGPKRYTAEPRLIQRESCGRITAAK